MSRDVLLGLSTERADAVGRSAGRVGGRERAKGRRLRVAGLGDPGDGLRAIELLGVEDVECCEGIERVESRQADVSFPVVEPRSSPLREPCRRARTVAHSSEIPTSHHDLASCRVWRQGDAFDTIQDNGSRRSVFGEVEVAEARSVAEENATRIPAFCRVEDVAGTPTHDRKPVVLDAVVVVGHSDRIGPLSYNMKVSERLAAMAKDYLVNNEHVDPHLIFWEGNGPRQPLPVTQFCNDRMSVKQRIECLAPNRRVTIEVIGTAVPQPALAANQAAIDNSRH